MDLHIQALLAQRKFEEYLDSMGLSVKMSEFRITSRPNGAKRLAVKVVADEN